MSILKTGDATTVTLLSPRDLVQSRLRTRRSGWPLFLMLMAWTTASVIASAQTPTPQALTLAAAIELARTHSPAIKESRARRDAAEQAVGVAQTAYLPRLDALW